MRTSSEDEKPVEKVAATKKALKSSSEGKESLKGLMPRIGTTVNKKKALPHKKQPLKKKDLSSSSEEAESSDEEAYEV